MKKLFLLTILMCSSVYADDFPLITPAEEKRLIKEIPLAKIRAKNNPGVTYCSVENVGSMRLYLDVPARLLFSYPGSHGVEKGAETPSIVLDSKTLKMSPEVEMTLKRNSIVGKISDQVQVYYSKTYEKNAVYENIAVMAFYLDNNNDVISNESILILSDNINGTYFVGSTRNCN